MLLRASRLQLCEHGCAGDEWLADGSREDLAFLQAARKGGTAHCRESWRHLPKHAGLGG